jgi:hypothetical protein
MISRMGDATYAVTWEQENWTEGTGRLELGEAGISLEGRHEGRSVHHRVRYGAIQSFRLARVNGDRLRSRPTLVLDLDDGGTLRIASLAQPGIVSEIADRLATVRPGADAHSSMSAAVVVPFKEGAREQVAELLEDGPPFDPKALGLERHEVFLGDREAIFVFEGLPAVVLERLLRDGVLANATEAWEPLLEGQAQFADQVYTWSG